MDLGLHGKAILVIGASAGLGRAVAEVLADEGARLFLVARRAAALEGVARSLGRKVGGGFAARLRGAGGGGLGGAGGGGLGGAGGGGDSGEFGRWVGGKGGGADGVEVGWWAADVAVPGEAEAAVAAAVEWAGRLDGVAVIAGPMGPRGPLHEQDDTAWDFYYQAGLMPVVRTLRAAVPHLVAAGGGAVVTTAAYSIRSQKPDMAHYSAIKSAVASLTKNVAKTYGPQGIRANCVAPGLLDTIDDEKRAALAARYGVDPADALYTHGTKGHGMSIALGRAGHPREAAELIAFLLSERTGYLTGATINIDGGTDF